MIKATSINEVISNLDAVIEWSILKQSRIGYFATLYRRMTIAVQQGIINNSFKDGPRMERLDVIFANRYLEAWDAYINKKPCSSAWCAAFDAAENKKLIVLQHLILGINTHINIDLAIAAAEVAPNDQIHDLKEDFEKINDVISSLTNDVQETLCHVWFPLRMLAKIANGRQEAVLNFSIDKARQASWASAVALATIQGDAHNNYITMMDNTVVKIANKVINPDCGLRFLLQPVRIMEDKNVGNIIGILKE